jgi:hypothetical protein
MCIIIDLTNILTVVVVFVEIVVVNCEKSKRLESGTKAKSVRLATLNLGNVPVGKVGLIWKIIKLVI